MSDGNFVSTKFVEVFIAKKENEWLFDWSRPIKANFRVFNLIADSVIQGRIAFKPNPAWNAYEIDIVEVASINRGHRDGSGKAYQGVGTLLFAEVVRRSFQDGYDGFVTFVAKTKLMSYYNESLGAVHIGDGRMVIATKAAKELILACYGGK